MLKDKASTVTLLGIAAAITVFVLVSVDSEGTPRSAQAIFHFAEIDEVMTSYGGDANVQFVEIEMLFEGQNITTNTVLGAFDASGNHLSDVLVVPGNVTTGANRPWLMGTTQFQTASGLIGIVDVLSYLAVFNQTCGP